jgi:hypothetical protein
LAHQWFDCFITDWYLPGKTIINLYFKYSETCLIRHTKGTGKWVRLYRMSQYSRVTYRETALLVDPQKSSAKTKQWVALVVGHELAHQWFGNLVTMVRNVHLFIS